METHREQWTAIKFYFKNGLTATEIFKMLQKAYIMNIYLTRTFSNGLVSFAMAERSWMIIREQGAPEPVEHQNTSQTMPYFSR